MPPVFALAICALVCATKSSICFFSGAVMRWTSMPSCASTAAAWNRLFQRASAAGWTAFAAAFAAAAGGFACARASSGRSITSASAHSVERMVLDMMGAPLLLRGRWRERHFALRVAHGLGNGHHLVGDRGVDRVLF